MTYALILSGGTGVRLGANIPKQYIEVNGKPIIGYTLERFFASPRIDKIVIAAAESWRGVIERAISGLTEKPYAFADAGASRQASIRNGLNKCVENGVTENDGVIIHDAARPLVGDALIENCLDGLKDGDAVMPAIKVSDTVYTSADGLFVGGLLDRDRLFAGQAPEAFRLKKYCELNAALTEDELNAIRGSSELAFKNGLAVKLTEGDARNFKITTAEDLERFKQIITGGNK